MKENVKDALRLIINQFFIITVCAMFIICAVNTLASGNFEYEIDATFPWVMMLTGLLGSLPSLLFCFGKEPTKKQFFVRVIIHFFLIQAVILTEGRLLGWYSTLPYMLIIAGMITMVYALVWVFSYLSEKNTAKNINKALENFNRDEES